MNYTKAIYLKAYAHINLGDDLFMDIIFRRYSNVMFYIECDLAAYESFFKEYANVKCIFPETSFFKRGLNYLKKIFLPALRKKAYKNHYESILNTVDGMVVIGGSMFMQGNADVEKDFDISFYKMAKEIMGNKPMFFLGCNFGPFSSPEYKAAYDNIFASAYDVCFREKYSYNLFKDLGNVRVQPDIVFSYKKDFEITQEPKSVGFSIVPAEKAKLNIDESAYVSKYSEMINKFIEKDYTVKLFSFCEREGDEKIIEDVLGKLNTSSKIHKVFYKGDVKNFLMEYASVESIFCGRFHALILSMVFNQKIVPVSYSKKMVNILEDINYKDAIIDLSEIITYDLSEVTTLPNRNYNASEAERDGILHFEKLDAYINNY